MTSGSPETYWRIVAREFRKSRIASAGCAILIVFFAAAVMADFIANDKPLAMKYQRAIYLPVLKDYSVRLGLAKWDPQFRNVSFKQFAKTNFSEGDWAQFPPVPYSPTE